MSQPFYFICLSRLILLLGLTLPLSGASHEPPVPTQGQTPDPKVQGGVLDLTPVGKTAIDSAVYKLDGDWNFYWRHDRTANLFQGFPPYAVGNITVPGTWQDQKPFGPEGAALPASGKANYAVLIRLPKSTQTLYAYVPAMYATYVFVSAFDRSGKRVVESQTHYPTSWSAPHSINQSQLIALPVDDGEVRLQVYVESILPEFPTGLLRSVQVSTNLNLLNESKGRIEAVSVFCFGFISLIFVLNLLESLIRKRVGPGILISALGLAFISQGATSLNPFNILGPIEFLSSSPRLYYAVNFYSISTGYLILISYLFLTFRSFFSRLFYVFPLINFLTVTTYLFGLHSSANAIFVTSYVFILIPIVRVLMIIKKDQTGDAKVTGYGFALIALLLCLDFGFVTYGIDDFWVEGLLELVFTITFTALEAKRAARAHLEAVSAKAHLEDLNKHLEDKITERTKSIEKASREMKLVMDHIQQGICLIDDKMCITGKHSQFLQELAGTSDLSGKSISDLFFKNSNLTSDQIHIAREVVGTCIGDNLVSFEMNCDNLPREIIRTLSNGRKQHLDFELVPVIDDNERVTALMCTLRDMTLIRELDRESAKSRLEIQMITELIALKPSQIRFFKETENAVAQNELILRGLLSGLKNSTHPTQNELATLFRALHTIKGNARVLGLGLIATQVHEIESRLGKADAPELITLHRDLREFLGQYTRLLEHRLSQFSQTASEVSSSQFEKVFQMAKRLFKRRGVPEASKNSELSLEILKMKTTSFRALLGPIETSAHKLALQLGKPAPRFVIEGPEVWIENGPAEALRGALNHLATNSMDHGIQTDAANAEIAFSHRCGDGSWLLQYRDSGRGLNLLALEKKGLANGLLSTSASDHQIANLIFVSGISSRDAVSEISGRGVGMDAFKASIEELGGNTQVVLTGRKIGGFQTFEIHASIPFQKETPWIIEVDTAQTNP